MNLPPLTRQQVRSVDLQAIERYGMSGLVLMENAGRGAAALIADWAAEGPIAILCGSGNNAGDGYVIARHLELVGARPRLVSLVPVEKLSGDALANARIAIKAKIPLREVVDVAEIEAEISGARMIVECLLGTGASGAPRGMFASAIRVANESPALTVAIDIPAGVDCDTGIAHQPALAADHTITFVARKVGFSRGDAADLVGKIHEVGIGVPRMLLESIGG